MPLLSAFVKNGEPKSMTNKCTSKLITKTVLFYTHQQQVYYTECGNELCSYFPLISPNSTAICSVLNYKNTLQHMEEQSTLVTDAIRTYLLSFYCVARNTLPVINGNFTKPL